VILLAQSLTFTKKMLGLIRLSTDTGGKMPAVRAWTDEPVALVMDNFSGHDVNCVDATGQVKLHFSLFMHSVL
jgi:hypothetical protein